MNKIEAILENSAMTFEELKEFNPSYSDDELQKWAKANKKNHAIDLLFIYIDGVRIDKLLARKVNYDYFGLWCSLLDLYDEDYIVSKKEKEYVWSKVTITTKPTILPILLCPDDWDFSCIVILVEVTQDEDIVIWNRFGLDNRASDWLIINEDKFEKDENGNLIFFDKINWFDNLGPFVFEAKEYDKMLKTFKSWRRGKKGL